MVRDIILISTLVLTGYHLKLQLSIISFSVAASCRINYKNCNRFGSTKKAIEKILLCLLLYVSQ